MSSTLELGAPELQRWYILIVSSLVSALQCNTWFTFSSVPSQVEQYYHLQQTPDGDVNSVIDLLLNWGPIMAFPSIPLTAYLLLFPMKGLKYSVKLAASLVFFGCFIRCIPTVLSQLFVHSYSISNAFWTTLIFLHIGQILNAIAGVLIMSVPSKLSVIWFPENERKFATGCIGIAGALGNCFSFLCGPYLVQQPHDVAYMLYLDLFLAFIPFICIALYFPDSPGKLPSMAAKYALLSIPFESDAVRNNNGKLVNEPLLEEEAEDNLNANTKQNLVNFWSELGRIFRSKNTILMVLVGGFQSGISTAYNGVTQDMLSPLGLSDTEIGTIGFIQTGLNIVGGFVMGWIADRYFSKRLKLAMFVLFGLSILVLLVLLFILPSPWNDASIILADTGSVTTLSVLTVFMAMLGFLSGALVPFFYELTSEVSYVNGISEGTSSTLLVLIINAMALVFIGVGNWVGTKYETISNVIVYSICAILLSWVHEVYARK